MRYRWASTGRRQPEQYLAAARLALPHWGHEKSAMVTSLRSSRSILYSPQDRLSVNYHM